MLTTICSAILVINEVMASNAGEVLSPAVNFDSWIELYNPSSGAVDLRGMTLSDHRGNSWQIPAGFGSVPAGGYKVVWLGSNDIKSTQAPFKLDCDGGTITLTDRSGNLVAEQSYPAAMSRTAWARKSDGGDEWGWALTPTPGAGNQTLFAAERLSPPQVSEDSRLFSSTLTVEVDIPQGATLMYTTDGSLPQPPADGARTEDGVVSGAEPGASRRSTDGKFTVAVTTGYTFRLFQDGYLPSVPVTRSYIKSSKEYTFPVISIVGDQRYFTDPKIGLDCDGDGTNGKTGNGQSKPRNYNQPWDRPVNFSYIAPDGTASFSQDVNISVAGGWTRSQPQRSFKLKSNKVFDGQNRFDFPFFPQKPYIRSKVILLRNGGNDVWLNNSRFMDPALQTIVQRSGLDVDLQSYVPIVEYVNGKCRGILNLREPNNDKFVYANWGYDDDEIDMFENFKFSQGTADVLNRIYELGAHINDAGAYDELLTLLDIDEFTNWMAVQLFLGNEDWPDNNLKAYRSRPDGRYRFVLFDLDYSFGTRFYRASSDPFSFFASYKQMPFVTFFLNLLSHDAYRRRFIDTFCIVAGSVFESTRAAAIVNELAGRLTPMLAMTNDSHSPNRCANTIKTNLKSRLATMMSSMQRFSQFKLSGTKKQTVLLNADTEGAHLSINGIDVPYADFQGMLFRPAQLKATAPAGYRFVGWKSHGSVYATDESIDLPMGTTVSLTASFEPLTDDEKAEKGIAPVRINEVSAANGIFVNDHFKRNDWIELYNTTDQPIDVAGMYLSDNLQKPAKYQLSKGSGQAETVIPAHGYLTVWCDKLEPLSQLHASFKLAAEGGDVLLTAADQSWTDRLTYTAMQADQTAGRYPDGADSIFLMNVPTIAKANLRSSYSVGIVEPGASAVRDVLAAVPAFSVRYAVNALAIHAGSEAPQAAASSGQADGPAGAPLRVVITNMAGQPVFTTTATLSGGYAEVSLRHLPAGVYIATVADGQGRTVACKFIKST